jgi:hypothetical protein
VSLGENDVSRRLVVAIVVKDNARTISKIFRGIAGLKNVFDDIAFAVYENNYTDGTKDVLKRLSSEIEGVRVLSEDLSYEQQRQVASVRHKDGRVCRIEILAYARQRVRELVLEEFGDSNYVLVVDVDAVLFSFKGIERASNMIDAGIADCVTANGLTKRLKYRDAFAFRSLEHPIGPSFSVTIGRISSVNAYKSACGDVIQSPSFLPSAARLYTVWMLTAPVDIPPSPMRNTSLSTGSLIFLMPMPMNSVRRVNILLQTQIFYHRSYVNMCPSAMKCEKRDMVGLSSILDGDYSLSTEV